MSEPTLIEQAEGVIAFGLQCGVSDYYGTTVTVEGESVRFELLDDDEYADYGYTEDDLEEGTVLLRCSADDEVYEFEVDVALMKRNRVKKEGTDAGSGTGD